MSSWLVPDGPPGGRSGGVCHHFPKASGPERIGAEWWNSDGLPASTRKIEDEEPLLAKIFEHGKVTRDYFVVEDEEGRHFWLFREGLYEALPRSGFLHGVFA